jgi:hypothetical protein
MRGTVVVSIDEAPSPLILIYGQFIGDYNPPLINRITTR